MVLKTRDRLIEVARQLFLMKGIENTTMIDIANASENGRRTVYTYFKSKSDIYNAVIERESEIHVSELREIASLELPASDKLRKYLRCHFEKMREQSFGYDSIAAWISLDFSRADKIKRAVLAKEIDLIKSILREGVVSGDFDSRSCDLLLQVLPALMQTARRHVVEQEKQHGNMTSRVDSDLFVDFILNSVRNNNNTIITSK